MISLLKSDDFFFFHTDIYLDHLLQNSFFAIDTNQSVHSQEQTAGTTQRTLAVSPDFTFSLVISWSSVELV